MTVEQEVAEEAEKKGLKEEEKKRYIGGAFNRIRKAHASASPERKQELAERVRKIREGKTALKKAEHKPSPMTPREEQLHREIKALDAEQDTLAAKADRQMSEGKLSARKRTMQDYDLAGHRLVRYKDELKGLQAERLTTPEEREEHARAEIERQQRAKQRQDNRREREAQEKLDRFSAQAEDKNIGGYFVGEKEKEVRKAQAARFEDEQREESQDELDRIERARLHEKRIQERAEAEIKDREHESVAYRAAHDFTEDLSKRQALIRRNMVQHQEAMEKAPDEKTRKAERAIWEANARNYVTNQQNEQAGSFLEEYGKDRRMLMVKRGEQWKAEGPYPTAEAEAKLKEERANQPKPERITRDMLERSVSDVMRQAKAEKDNYERMRREAQEANEKRVREMTEHQSGDTLATMKAKDDIKNLLYEQQRAWERTRGSDPETRAFYDKAIRFQKGIIERERPASEAEREHLRQEEERRHPAKPEKKESATSWSIKYATSKTPEDPEVRRKWYAEQWNNAPHKLTIYETSGRSYDLPFATKAEAQEKMRSASADAYKAELDGKMYQRTKNYGWSAK